VALRLVEPGDLPPAYRRDAGVRRICGLRASRRPADVAAGIVQNRQFFSRECGNASYIWRTVHRNVYYYGYGATNRWVFGAQGRVGALAGDAYHVRFVSKGGGAGGEVWPALVYDRRPDY